MSDQNAITVDPRQQRGMRIADRMRIEKKRNGFWAVPSESADKKYTVDLARGGWCSCPDHDERGVKCKHIWAVEFTVKRETNEQGEVTETRTVRATYSQEWTHYNAAQTTEKASFARLLAALVEGVPPETQTMGRPRLPMADMVFATVYKVYSTVSGRRFMCDLNDAYERGYVSQLPHYNSIFRYMDTASMTPILTELVTESAMPLRAVETNFAVDSSGFATTNHITWYDHKYGDAHEKAHWLKAHLMCGVKTNVVTAVEIGGALSQDTSHFIPLVKHTARHFQMAEISADKAYLSLANLEAIDAAGADAFIPFKRNSRPVPWKANARVDTHLWEKMWHYFQFQQDAFMEHYHQRSNVETTFSMIKRKFGSALRSKSDVGQVNELLAKIVAHNICCLNHAIHELGLEPVFWR